MTQELNSLFDEIKSNLDMNLTGYGMFKFNKEFVSGFISSVITFSVLLFQDTTKFISFSSSQRKAKDDHILDTIELNMIKKEHS